MHDPLFTVISLQTQEKPPRFASLSTVLIDRDDHLFEQIVATLEHLARAVAPRRELLRRRR